MKVSVPLSRGVENLFGTRDENIRLLESVLGVTTRLDTDTLVIHATARLVQLNVAVLDKKGHPADGQTQDDFRIFDNGHEQQIVHFVAGSAPAPASAPDRSPLVIANRSQAQDETPRTTTAILIDATFATLREMQSTRLEVLRFLKALQPGDRVGLYVLEVAGVVVLRDVTEDTASLTSAAKYLGTGVRGANIPMESGRILPGSSQEPVESEELQTVLMKRAVQVIIDRLQGIPGRKNLIWVSSGFLSMSTDFDPGKMAGELHTIDPPVFGKLPVPVMAWTQNNNERLVGVARRLSNANISIYPIDARGLVGPVAVGLQGADQSFHESPQALLPSTFSDQGRWSAMDLFASETGGHAFYDTNGLGDHMREVVDETRIAYVLGYYPGDDAWDGRYHKIEVKSKSGDLAVRCRKGYVASDRPLSFDPETAWGALESSGIGVTLKIPSNPLEWYRQDIVVKLETRNIHFEQRDGRWRANVELAFVQFGKDGRVLSGIDDKIEFGLAGKTSDDAAAQGWSYPKTLDVKPVAA